MDADLLEELVVAVFVLECEVVVYENMVSGMI